MHNTARYPFCHRVRLACDNSSNHEDVGRHVFVSSNAGASFTDQFTRLFIANIGSTFRCTWGMHAVDGYGDIRPCRDIASDST
jgi:hypothetical protein